MINEDTSGWTTSMIYARLVEIDGELERLWKDYCDRKNCLIMERDRLQNQLGNRDILRNMNK